MFQYLMKLHYSQTVFVLLLLFFPVSVPYEITLLSNTINGGIGNAEVSVPYEITLLSNRVVLLQTGAIVSVPYEITLLSNPRADLRI